MINPPKKEIKKNNVILPKKLVPINQQPETVITPIESIEKKRKSNSQNGGNNKKKKVNRKEKGLRHFSLKVCEKVQNKGKTSYSEVANELVEEFIDKDLNVHEQKNEEKNIRRRVYDALNVLMALDIIGKDKKDILWKGFSNKIEDENILNQKEILEMNKQRKKQQIEDLLKTQNDLKKVIELNESTEYQKSNSLSRIELPFILVSTDKGAEIDCEINPIESKLFLNFNMPFHFNDDHDIASFKFNKL